MEHLDSIRVGNCLDVACNHCYMGRWNSIQLLARGVLVALALKPDSSVQLFR